jgi:hypothetical protein
MAHLSYWFVVAAPLALFSVIYILNRIMVGLDRLLDDGAVLLHGASRLIARSKSSVIAVVDEPHGAPSPKAVLID